ncbi:MAG: hypothetical protein ABWY06_19295 [Pseudomonas sp.]|uniref:hypothetical protein n=1 Tax=Pseudomonas sp. TaxID=306 RepID=UPI003399CC2D
MINLRKKPFAVLCYRRRSIRELQLDLQGFANSEDCQAWSLTAHEWREQIKLALRARMENQPI